MVQDLVLVQGVVVVLEAEDEGKLMVESWRVLAQTSML